MRHVATASRSTTEDFAAARSVLGLCLWLALAAAVCAAPVAGRRALLVELQGPIGPAVSDFVVRALTRAENEQAALVILRMDTPGGLDSAMRDIVRKVLGARVPVVAYVAPAGARAASAGTYILYASHVAAMAPGTNLGAATPMQIVPEPLRGTDEPAARRDRRSDGGRDRRRAQREDAPGPGPTAERKLVNDAVAYIRALAAMRGRNADWAERAVREAASLTAEDARRKGVIELVAQDLDALLAQLDGRRVQVMGQPRTLRTGAIELLPIEPDWRNRLLAAITDPNVAYVLLLLGIYGLLFELANPGFVLPGVAGAVALLLAFYAFQVLPVNYAGLALILLGIAFMLGEAFVPSLGALGIGGVIAFAIGSVLLIDTELAAFTVSVPLIVALAVTSAGFFIGLGVLALRNRRRPIVSGREQLIGSVGEAVDTFADRGRVRVEGEIWEARSSRPIAAGAAVRVFALDGLVLQVEPADPEN